MLAYIREALNGWSYVYQQPKVPFSPPHPSLGCTALSGAVKKLLGSCPSSDRREVLAFQSIKKGLPPSCKCMESKLLDDVVTNVIEGCPPVLPPGYLSFVKARVSQLFPKGWDHGYEGFACRTAPPLKGTLEKGRAQGGCLEGFSAFSQSDYLSVVLNGDPTRTPSVLRGAFQVVQSAGKPRPLTTFSQDGLFLKPLHKTIYGSLSKRKWLQRGDVTDASLRKAGFEKGRGGDLVSGDYASATDNLSIEVFETCLSVMLENALNVPGNIKEFALRSCRPWLWECKEDWQAAQAVSAFHGVSGDRGYMELKKGQMMGSYLSFPLLCLQNYLAFQWSRRSFKGFVPVLINGDDILFQAPRQLYSSWFSTVGSLGFSIEVTKTSVSSEFGTLNSTLLEWAGNYLRVVPTLRFGMLSPADYPLALGRTFESFLSGIVGGERYRAGRLFFEFHLGELKASAFSMTSLGFRGALAHRLSRVFGLLSSQRIDAPPPETPSYHSVCLSRDLISEVPNEFVTTELKDLDAVETAAWKWSTGYEGRSLESSAVQYAIGSTRWSSDPFLPFQSLFWATDREFEWLLRNVALGGVDTPTTRRSGLKRFLEPFPKKTVTRVFWTAAQHMFNICSAEFGPPPTYDESLN